LTNSYRAISQARQRNDGLCFSHALSGRGGHFDEHCACIVISFRKKLARVYHDYLQADRVPEGRAQMRSCCQHLQLCTCQLLCNAACDVACIGPRPAADMECHYDSTQVVFATFSRLTHFSYSVLPKYSKQATQNDRHQTLNWRPHRAALQRCATAGAAFVMCISDADKARLDCNQILECSSLIYSYSTCHH